MVVFGSVCHLCGKVPLLETDTGAAGTNGLLAKVQSLWQWCGKGAVMEGPILELLAQVSCWQRLWSLGKGSLLEGQVLELLAQMDYWQRQWSGVQGDGL